MRIHWSLRLLIAAANGYLWSLGFNPHSLAGAAWAVMALLLFLTMRVNGWLAAGGGFLFGVAFHTASLPWIYSVMRVHGHLGPAPAAGVMALMVLYLALFPAAFCWSVARVSTRSLNGALCAAPFLWVALEYAQTHVPILGFPWNLAGYVPAKHPGLLQLATVTGIYGLSFAVVASGSLFAWVVLASRKPVGLILRFALACVLALAVLVPTHLGVLSATLPKPEHVAFLVQSNFPQAPEYPANWMDLHAAEMDELERISIDAGSLIAEGGAERSVPRSMARVRLQGAPAESQGVAASDAHLIIWPEVPAPFYFLDPKFAARAERVARESYAYFLVGVVEWRPGPNDGLLPYNSAVLLDPSGKRAFQYDKIHLVPFGEYVPLRRVLKFAESLVAEIGDYRAGTARAVGQLPGGRFGVLICYEAIFPDEVRRFVANGAELLVNISNDGWYGRSAAPEQHLAMARVRAVENRRWLLRGTNNGYTVVIDPYGREVARLAPDIRGVLRAPFSFRSERTIYSRWGDWLAWLCVVGSVGFLLWPGRRK